MRNSGFTLFELLITLVIAGVLLAWGFPSLIQSIQNNQVASQNMDMMAMVNLTKNEAIRRNTNVTMVVSSSDAGWEAIIEDPNNEADIEGCAIGQLRCSSNTGASIEMCNGNVCSGSFELEFNNRGYFVLFDEDDDPLWQTRTIFLQHDRCSGQNQRRRLDVLPSGQVSSCSLACDDTDECP